MKKSIIFLFILIASTAFSQPVKPHTFSPADPVSSAKMNANFDTIYQWGSVASAAIELHKADTAAHGATGGVVGATKTQSLTNKTLDSSNSIDGAAIKTGMVAEARIGPEIARSIDVSVQIMSHEMLTQAHGATGAVVGTTNAQTLTNKTIGTGSTWNGNAISDAYLNTAYSHAAMSGHRNSITSADTRNTNYEPDDRNRGFYADFKGNATDGLSDGSTYHGVLTFRPYGFTSDMSGGYPFQLGFTENINLWLRKGTSATAWSSWYKLFHSGHTIPDGNIDSALARDSEVTSAISTHAGLTATHGATGAIMGTTNTQTAYPKTLYSSADTSSPYWHKNNDGAGSGLDADTLDGNNSSFFATAASLAGYLPLAGGTMSGVLTLKNDVYGDSYSTGALNLRNSNIYGANGFFFGDAVDSTAEGIHFYNSSTSTDWLYAASGNLYFAPNRTIGTLGTSYTLWHAGNDGSGSGLDADTLDGLNYSAFSSVVPNNSYAFLGATYISGGTEKPSYFGSGKLKLQMLSGGNVGAPDGWNDCLWMSSYTGGDVKPSNLLILGKYTDSIGFCRQNYDSTTWGTYRKIWHSGNQGEGSGLDADLLDGYHAVTANAVRTIPVRDGSGDITTRLFRSTYAEQTTAPATTADIAFRNDTSDNYIRFMSANAFKNWMINSKIGVVQTSAPASPVDGDIWVE